ncbi:MAG: hypothetical protein QM691_06275 [Opitutaceae bacterium]
MPRIAFPRLLLFIALVASCALHSAPRWRLLKAPHCELLSQLPDDETRQWAAELERFVAAARGLLVIDEEALPDLTVVLFETGQFGPYQPRDTSKRVRKDVGGIAGNGIIAIGNTRDRFRNRRILFHEATHWLLIGSRSSVPLWLNEGLAEALSSFEPGPDFGTLGLSLGEHIDCLQSEVWVPWGEILGATHNDPLYRDPERVHQFYAESWLFVHRLLFLDPQNGAAALDRHSRTRLHGANPTRAFSLAIEKDFELVEAQLQTYARKTRFTPRRLACPREIAVTGSFERAAAVDVETALALIAVGARRFDTALQHIERCRQLKSVPSRAAELLAISEDARNNASAAAVAAQQAIELGSDVGYMRLLVADASLDRELARTTTDEALRHLADPYLRVAGEKLRSADAYEGFARVCVRLTAPTEEEVRTLIRGREFFPDLAWPFVALAAVAHRRGDTKETQRLLELALTRGEITDRVRTPRTENGNPPLVVEHIARVEAHIESGRWAEAIGEFEALLAVPIPKD